MTHATRRSRWRGIVIAIVAILLIVVGVTGARLWPSIHAVAAGGGITSPINGRYTIALLGSDSAQWRDGARVDSTTVASVDATTGRTLLISIPRNLILIPFPTDSPMHQLYPNGYTCPNQATSPCMLTMVYQLGLDHRDLYPNATDPGAEAMVDAIEAITGLTLNYYAFIDMDGFESLIDALGGIDIDITTRVPIGASGATMYWLEPGRQHFTGPEALWYVRSRVDTDDYMRMTREKCVILATLDQLDPATIASRFLSLSDSAAATAHTNIPASQITTLANLAHQASMWTITSLSLTPPQVNPLNPDYPHIGQLVISAVEYVESLDGPDSLVTPPDTTDLAGTCG